MHLILEARQRMLRRIEKSEVILELLVEYEGWICWKAVIVLTYRHANVKNTEQEAEGGQ